MAAAAHQRALALGPIGSLASELQSPPDMPPDAPTPPKRPPIESTAASEQSTTGVTNVHASHAAGAREVAALADRVAVLSVALARAVEVGDEHAMTVLHGQIARIERFLRTVQPDMTRLRK